MKQQQFGDDGLYSIEDDDIDGFRTPTCKIPVPAHCLGAPKKNFKRNFAENIEAAKAICDQKIRKKDEEIAMVEDEYLEKKQLQFGDDGLYSTEDDDIGGFRTPTCRIPVPAHCLGAPKKSLNRKFERCIRDQELRKEDEEISIAGDDYPEKKQLQFEDGLSSSTEDDDDNDGFRTPTSLKHRIQVPTSCLPAPKKSSKRKIEGSITLKL